MIAVKRAIVHFILIKLVAYTEIGTTVKPPPYIFHF